ncbi:MAG: Mobile element protein, partial [uncultured Rubrobacteraceae bacterium]
ARGGPQPRQARSPNAGVPRPARLRGQDQEGGHAMPQALHRPRGLPHAANRTPGRTRRGGV